MNRAVLMIVISIAFWITLIVTTASYTPTKAHSMQAAAPYEFVVLWHDETCVQECQVNTANLYGTTVRDALDAFDAAYGSDRVILSVCRLDSGRCQVPKRSAR